MKILYRYILAWMGCMGIMNVYFTRINISVAMVAMVGVSQSKNRSESMCVDRFGDADETRRITEGEFDWSKQEQQLVMGSYYWGYTAFMIPAAWISTKIGFRYAFGFAMFGGAVVTLLFPLAAKASVFVALVVRILLGVLHAVAFPAMTGAWGAWAPPLEKTQLNGIYVSGASIGTLFIFTLAGYIADTLGWEAVFYVTGCFSLVWVVFWFLLVADTPAIHPRISKEEREYIETSIGQSSSLDRKNLNIPWKKILTSAPVWGIVLGHAASNWGNYTLNQQLPTYLSNVLRYSLSFNGVLSSICYIFQTLVCLIGSWLTDLIISKQLLKTLTIRKINTILGLWLPGACALLAVVAGCQAELAVVLFALAAGLNTLSVSGCKTGMLDIAPDFAGIVFGVSNTVANIPGFMGPAIVGALLTDYSNTNQWYYVFSLGCAVQILGSVLYLVKGSASLQDWAIPQDRNSIKKVSSEIVNDGFVEIKL